MAAEIDENILDNTLIPFSLTNRTQIMTNLFCLKDLKQIQSIRLKDKEFYFYDKFTNDLNKIFPLVTEKAHRAYVEQKILEAVPVWIFKHPFERNKEEVINVRDVVLPKKEVDFYNLRNYQILSKEEANEIIKANADLYTNFKIDSFFIETPLFKKIEAFQNTK
jgi:hypothetical protein